MKSIIAPPSKSYAHRMLICAALSSGTSVLSNYSTSDDMEATLNCISTLGATFSVSGDKISISNNKTGTAFDSASNFLYNCNESGSTLRFFIPLALALSGGGTFIGSERLIERGIGVYEDLFKPRNIQIIKNKDSISLHGKLLPGVYELPGNVSSQFITGLLFALPLLQGDSTIKITTNVESAAYIQITLDILELYGIKVEKKSNVEYFVPGGQKFAGKNLAIEGDWSNAAPFLAMGLEVGGLNQQSLQGDKVCIDLFKQLDNQNPPPIDISNCPDLGPVLFAYAASKNGGTFTGTSRLAIKECDRSQAMKEELAHFGVNVQVNQNSVIIPKQPLQAPKTTLQSHNDHRIVMALTYLILQTGGTIQGVNAINKSFPTFFQKLQSAGINIGELSCNCLKIQKS